MTEKILILCIGIIAYLSVDSNVTMATASSSSSSSSSVAFISSLSYSYTSQLIASRIASTSVTTTTAFLQNKTRQRRNVPILFMSSVGPGDDNNQGKDGDSMDKKESENLRQARAKISEERLPISFTADTTKNNNDKNEDNDANKDEDKEEKTGGAIELSRSSSEPGGPLAQNPYLQIISSVGPSELISKFTQSAHPRVQDAVRSTILGLLGNLPKMAFETTAITTAERLASLMFQLQMTGYMFKNAEYRLSLSQSLGMDDGLEDISAGGGRRLLTGDVAPGKKQQQRKYADGPGKVQGKIRVRYDYGKDDVKKEEQNTKQEEDKDDDDDDDDEEEEEEEKQSKEEKTSKGMEIEVDAAAYMSELRSEVSRLKDELNSIRNERQEAIRKDLLLYIRTLPEQEMKELTGTVSPEVLQAMKGLVNAVLGGISGGASDDEDGEEGAAMGIKPDTITEQSGEAMAQLLMWQLVVGYNLRELEVREGMKRSLLEGITKDSSDDDEEDPTGGYGYDLGTLGGGGFE